MDKTKLIALSAMMLMFVSVFAGFAGIIATNDTYADTSDDGEWDYEVLLNDTLKLTKYNGAGPDVEIPKKIDGKFVTEIGAHAFSITTTVGMSYVRSVIIPNTISVIFANAISNCNNIKEIHIPESVTNFAAGAIYRCSGLEKITVSEQNVKYHSFNGCLYDGTKLLLIPDALTEMTIEPGTTHLVMHSITTNSAVKTLYLPNTVSVIGTYVPFSHALDIYFEPGMIAMATLQDAPANWSTTVLHTHYLDVLDMPEEVTSKQYAVVSYNGVEDYVETGTAAVKPADPVGRETKYYTNAAKTTEFVWSTLISEDIELYTEMIDVPIDGHWAVRFVDEDGDLMEAFFVEEDTPADSAMAPTAEGVVYTWYADAALTTLYDWDEPVTGHITIYGVASAVGSDAHLGVTEIIILVGAAIIGILAIYTRNPYVALAAVILVVIAGLGYAGYLPLPETVVPGVNITLPTVNWPVINWPVINWPVINWPQIAWPQINWPTINWPKLW